jgi:ABC-type lipoprotein export system ATPase subunit
MSAGASITCENLVKIYSLGGAEVMALQGLDLAIAPGEIVGIVGSSGSGKSTLLNVLGGLDRPSAGRVGVNGRELLKLSDRELDDYRRTQVGFVWQQTGRNLLHYLTALENVEIPLRLMRQPAGERRKQACRLLEELGLGERLARLPVQLSGGEQQRVAIAVAIANRPALLLADEPTGELDSLTARDIYAALREANARYGMTILIVSHDPNIGQHCQRVIAIRDGKTSTETVRSKPVGPDKPQADAGHALKAIEFEELVVLDAAGRLQIPRDYLEALNIGDRVRLEIHGEQILIHPVAGYGRASPPAGSTVPVEALYVAEDQAPESAGPAWLTRLRRLSQLERWASFRLKMQARRRRDD